MLEVLREAQSALERGEPVALVILSKRRGSGPRMPGTMMLVRRDGSIVGTIGGGTLEKRLIDETMEVLKEERVKSISFDLTEKDRELGLYCGGEVEFLIIPLLPKEKLLIFGAGHISRALAPLALQCGFRVTVVDDRESLDTESFPLRDKVLKTKYQEFIEGLEIDDSTFIVIATESHEKDFSILSGLLRKEHLPIYLGMLGSRTKFNTFKKRAEKEIKKRLDIVRTPVGLDIGAETPEEIAISIIGEMISVKRKAASRTGRGKD